MRVCVCVAEPSELQKCLFTDSLVTVSEGGRDLGEFSVTVDFSSRGPRPCLLLRAVSSGSIDGTSCGTRVTGGQSVGAGLYNLR